MTTRSRLLPGPLTPRHSLQATTTATSESGLLMPPKTTQRALRSVAFPNTHQHCLKMVVVVVVMIMVMVIMILKTIICSIG